MVSDRSHVLRILCCAAMSTVLLANDREKANEKLLTAIRSNRLDAIHAALGAGASPNTSDSRGASALMYAVLYSDPTIVSLLLLRGAQQNHSDADGASPLLWAVNDVLKTRMLLQAGANVNVTSKFGMTPILVASAWPNNAAVVRLLLAHGADPKAAGGGGETTLTRATYLGDVQTVELLLTVGVDPNVKGFAGRTPLMNAVQRGDRRMVAALLRSGADVRATDAKQQSVLIRNGYWNDARIVQSLIDRGLDVSTPDSQGRDALLFAAASETATEEVVRMLLRHGAKVARSPEGRQSACASPGHLSDTIRGTEYEVACSLEPIDLYQRALHLLPSPVASVPGGRTCASGRRGHQRT
jgi:uncharacterized protein